MVDWAIVEWSDEAVPIHRLNDLDEEEHDDFYAILAGVPDRRGWSNLRTMYIGSAYRQLVSKRIRQDHSAYAALTRQQDLKAGEQFVVMTGWVADASLERVTEPFVLDVEGVLIYRNRPRWNTRNRDSYSGRHLVVVNRGDFDPLKERSSCCGPTCVAKWRKLGGASHVRDYDVDA